MKKINIRYILLAFIAVIALGSCRKDRVVGGTEVQNLAGQWWVKIDGGTNPDFGAGYFSVLTYNTSANSANELWIEDEGSFWDIKGKVKADASALTFSGTNVVNQSYSSHFTITDGKVMLGVARGPVSKAKTDSISFKVSFDDETPVKVHTVTGYKRTYFTGDDH